MKTLGTSLHTPFGFQIKINALKLFFSVTFCLPRFKKYFRIDGMLPVMDRLYESRVQKSCENVWIGS